MERMSFLQLVWGNPSQWNAGVREGLSAHTRASGPQSQLSPQAQDAGALAAEDPTAGEVVAGGPLTFSAVGMSEELTEMRPSEKGEPLYCERKRSINYAPAEAKREGNISATTWGKASQ
jgi:hypothetical protein